MMFTNKLLARWYQPTLNWGDALNPYLIERLSEKKVANTLYPRINFRKLLQRSQLTKQSEYLVIGSILSWGHSQPDRAEIWGAGFMSPSESISKKPRAVHAVRGRLSQQVLLNQGIECPDVFGDPALLLPLLYNPVIAKKFKIGVIPHYVDKNLASKLISSDQDYLKIIDIEQDIESFVDEILECSVIISSSLHGLIAADAYGIPSRHITFSNNISGGDFKFKDYYSGIGSNYFPSISIKSFNDLSNIESECIKHSIPQDTIKKLLSSCPFISNSVYDCLSNKIR